MMLMLEGDAIKSRKTKALNEGCDAIDASAYQATKVAFTYGRSR